MTTWIGPDSATLLAVPAAVLTDDAARAGLAARAAAGGALVAVLELPRTGGPDRHAELARAAHGALGDRVDVWLTGHDPLRAARAAAGATAAAATTATDAEVLVALHRALLAHGAAARALREAGADVVGTGVHLEVTRPADPADPNDLAAALEADLLTNHVVLGPLLDGTYPVEARAAAGLADWDHVRPGDLVAIRQRVDVLLVEHSGTRTVARADDSPRRRRTVHEADTPGGRTVEPVGLYEVLGALDNAYDVPLLALVDPAEIGADRVAEHHAQARSAADDGVAVRGLIAAAP